MCTPYVYIQSQIVITNSNGQSLNIVIQIQSETGLFRQAHTPTFSIVLQSQDDNYLRRFLCSFQSFYFLISFAENIEHPQTVVKRKFNCSFANKNAKSKN
jgi:hypothetical protein